MHVSERRRDIVLVRLVYFRDATILSHRFQARRKQAEHNKDTDIESLYHVIWYVVIGEET